MSLQPYDDMYSITAIDLALKYVGQIEQLVIRVCPHKLPQAYVEQIENGKTRETLLELMGWGTQHPDYEVPTAIRLMWLTYVREDILKRGVDAVMQDYAEWITTVAAQDDLENEADEEMEKLIAKTRAQQPHHPKAVPKKPGATRRARV